MEANSTRRRWTYADFTRLPSETSTRYEVIDGELFVTPGPALRHQGIVMHLASQLHVFARSHDLGQVFTGPLDVLFAEGDYFEPDIVFVQKDRAELLSERGVEGPPDLVVEILSPSTAARDRGIKLERYRLFGVPEYWVVDPDARTVEVWRLAENPRDPCVIGAADTLRWTPVSGGVTLQVPVAELLGPA